MSECVLVCDDEELIRWSLCEHLGQEGYRTISVTNGKECLEAVREHAPAIVLMDIKMPVMDGITALRALRESDPDLPVIMITAHGGVESAIEATRLGASGYLPKPFDLREASLAVRRALEEVRLKREVHYLRTREHSGYAEIVGESPTMRRMFETLRRLERIDTPTVLIQGESGTGKDLVARAIHGRGPRRAANYMEIDCTALPEHLMESELFGHERGAFTDARTTKRGLFEVAAGGVLFLDEIGELPMGMQAKLLRALENRKFRRVGGVADIALDAAIITATNRSLRDEVKAGRFREDLFFRLHVVPIEVPALRERREDIPMLVQVFIEKLNRTLGRTVRGTSAGAMEMLQRYRWPGNVRELRNVVERTVILLPGEIIQPSDLPPEIRLSAETTRGGGGACPFVLPEEGVDLEAVERGLLEQALTRTSGNQSAAARLLGITRYALRYRMEKFGADGAAK
ncbi:MAG: sigma-54 dependent transcriptional regulator [Pseudomonadota bacterium]|nr:sigma-54 dependent transcriptional regulator [Pseudomonadota bacterium]